MRGGAAAEEEGEEIQILITGGKMTYADNSVVEYLTCRLGKRAHL